MQACSPALEVLRVLFNLVTEVEDPRQRFSRLSRAPTPPPPHRSPSLGYMARKEQGSTREGARHGHGDRNRGRSRSRSGIGQRDHSADSFLRPGDHITAVEHGQPRATDDYDWYDKQGMKVRVREI